MHPIEWRDQIAGRLLEQWGTITQVVAGMGLKLSDFWRWYDNAEGELPGNDEAMQRIHENTGLQKAYSYLKAHAELADMTTLELIDALVDDYGYPEDDNGTN